MPPHLASTYQTGVIKSVLTASRSGKIRRHIQPYVSLALWGAWDLEFRYAHETSSIRKVLRTQDGILSIAAH